MPPPTLTASIVGIVSDTATALTAKPAPPSSAVTTNRSRMLNLTPHRPSQLAFH